jgi:hypothetical protein
MKIRPDRRRAAAEERPKRAGLRSAARAGPAGASRTRATRRPRLAKVSALRHRALVVGLALALVATVARGTRIEAAPSARAAAEKSDPGQPPARPAPGTLEMLDLLSRAGRAFSGQRFDSAARLYRQAFALDPRDAQPLVMAGVAAYEAHTPAVARRDLRLAMGSSRLLPQDRELALTYLGLIEEDLQSAALAPMNLRPETRSSLSLATSVGGGYDSNARQTRLGALDTENSSGAPASGSVFASAGVELGMDASLGDHTDVEIGLAARQSFYPDRARADLDFQEYELRLQASHRFLDWLTARFAASSDLSYSGLGTALRPFQSSVRLEPQLLFGSSTARLRLTGAWQAISTHDPTLGQLSGRRLEVSVTPAVPIGDWRVSLGGRVRHNALGTDRTPLGPSEDPFCPACTSTQVLPYSHTSMGGTFLLSGPYRWRIRPSLVGRWEIRLYDDPQHTERTGSLPAERGDFRSRRDEHLALGSGLTVRLATGLILGLRYEQSAFASSLTPIASPAGCSPPACAGESGPERRGYRKHAWHLDLTIVWL